MGDGCSQEISDYWQELFDHDGDEFKEEIQRGWQTEGTDLLIISAVQVSPRFEASAIGLAALGRTVELFGRSCDLVACFPKGIESYVHQGPSQTISPSQMANAVAVLKNNV